MKKNETNAHRKPFSRLQVETSSRGIYLLIVSELHALIQPEVYVHP